LCLRKSAFEAHNVGSAYTCPPAADHPVILKPLNPLHSYYELEENPDKGLGFQYRWVCFANDDRTSGEELFDNGGIFLTFDTFECEGAACGV